MSNIKIESATIVVQLGVSELEYNTFYYCVDDGQTYILINTNTDETSEFGDAIVSILNTKHPMSICDVGLDDYKFIKYSTVNMKCEW